jgi:hypothetical protein
MTRAAGPLSGYVEGGNLLFSYAASWVHLVKIQDVNK